MMKSVLLVSNCLLAASFLHAPKSSHVLKTSRCADEQEIKDLNLEQMFDVFEEADKKVKVPGSKKASSSSSFNAAKEVGSSSPFGFFDPAGFAADVSRDQFKLYQEAEIKHGRVSMVAFLGLVFGELLQNGGPLFNGQITGPAIYQYQQADAMFPFSALVLSIIGAIEAYTITKAWQPLGDTLNEPTGLAKLKEEHTPGDLGFDPLGFKPKSVSELDTIRVKELNNGRLAMLAVAGIVAQELVTNQPIF